nr:PREDICTED: calponin homology domain-containing protein 2 [Equus przewalskii]
MATHLDKQKIILKADRDASPVKTRDTVVLSCREAELPSPIRTKFGGAEPARKKLFVGMETIHERSNLGKSGTSKKEGNRRMEKEEKNEDFFFPEAGTQAYHFFQKVVNAAQTWFSLFGWAEGPHSLSIPETVRRDVYKIRCCSSPSSSKKFVHNDFSKYNKTIYDVMLHLSGKMPDGINSSQSLPVDHTERVLQLRLQHSSLLDFLSTQGACISHVLPEFLLEPEDYKKWIEITSSTNTFPVSSYVPKEEPSIVIEMSKFEACSKRAWTDVFLQTYKVLILSRIVPHCSSNLLPMCMRNSPEVNSCFMSSNIYSNSERILLNWMNTNYENTRHIIWKDCEKGVIPSERWIINFDKDLLDGLVFATLLGAYCPFLIESHFVNMYTQPKSCEQYLHNCLIIVNVLHEIGFDMDIQATDICDPNPILMLMLCVYMYESLPTYLPKKVVLFHCTLHDTVLRRIGELIYAVEGNGMIPLPSSFLPMSSSSNPLDYSSSPEEECNNEDPVLYLKCKLRQILDVDLRLPLINDAKEKALVFAAQQQMSSIEYERRLITGTLESSSVRVAIALLGLTKIEVGIEAR